MISTSSFSWHYVDQSTECAVAISASQDIRLEPPQTQNLLLFNVFHCIDVHLGRAASLFVSIFVQILAQHLPSTKYDQIQHCLSYAAQLQFKSNQSFLLPEEHTFLGTMKNHRPIIHDQITGLLKLLHYVFSSSSVLVHRVNLYPEQRQASLYLVHAFISGKLGMLYIEFMHPWFVVYISPAAS